MTTHDHSDKPCDICGDIGVVEAIVTCSQCRIACEHVYCKKICTKDVPEVWICEACELSTEMASPKSGVNEDLPTCSAGSKKLTDDSGRRICFKWEKTVAGKVKFLSAQEAITLSSGAKKSESISKGNLHSSPGPSKAMVSMSMRTPVKPKATHPKFSLYNVKENPRFRPPEHFKPPRHGNIQINSVVQPQVTQTSKELQGNKAVLAPMKQHIHKGQPIVSLKHAVEIESTCAKVEKATCKASYASSLSTFCPTIVSSGDNICTDVVPRNSNAENGDLLLKSDKCFTSHPALDASWKGSFKILDTVKHGELTDGLQAHPPSKVRRKVYELSKQMPRILQFELLPRCHFWTDMFQNDYPDTDDIALYFFSHDSERSENYIFLLEYIERHDLVMRSNMGGMELLVLTSKLLHLNSQRWNEKCFLWGVFRRMKKYEAILEEHGKIPLSVCASDNTSDSRTGWEDSEVVDMEIDMIGGKDVGRVDIKILKESLKRGCGSSGEENATPISLHGSDVKNPVVKTKINFPNKLPLLDLNKESCNDIPPGFEEACRLKFRASSCRVTVKEEKLLQKAISPAKENISMGRVSVASGGNSSRPEPMKDSVLLGVQERNHQVSAHGTMAACSSPSSVKNDRLRRSTVTVKKEVP